MNYLGHFFFNQKILPPEEPSFHLGAAVPDLLSSYDRNLRLRLRPVKQVLEKKPVSPFWRGIENHLVSDDVFHKSAFFSTTGRVLKDLFATVPDHKNRRKFFLAHIGCELLLDHCILLENPTICTAFYEVLDRADRQTGFRELRDHFDQPMRGIEDFMERFMEIRFVFRYHSLSNLVTGINRILVQTGQEPFSNGEQEIFAHALEKARPSVLHRLTSLSNELRVLAVNGKSAGF